MIILGTNSIKDTGYDVANSLRFNQNDDCLIKTFGSGGNKKKFTFSLWIKLSGRGTGNNNGLLVAGTSGNDEGTIRLSNDIIDWVEYDSGTSAVIGRLTTNQVFRDYSAWSHLVFVWDSANATAGNRMRIYHNGSEITSFSDDTNPSVNYDAQINNNVTHNIGRQSWNNSGDYNGYMSEVVFIDGQALAPTDFGEFDENSGIWKPIDVSGLTFGNNGFYLDFKNSGALGADVSGESNNFTVNNLTSIDQSTDTCTNNFATWNPVLAMNSTMVIADGNLTGTTASNYASGASNSWFSTVGVSSGKWYAEFKESAGTNNQGQILGVGYDLSKHQQGATASAYNLGGISEGWGYLGAEGTVKNNNSAVLTSLSTWTVGDIVCIALDMDNHKLYFRKNGGSWENSGNPESGSTGTGAISLTTGETYFFACSDASLSNTYTFQANFGSPPFAITSGNTDGNDRGNFEYAPPSGYLSLCTANLSEVLG